MTSKTITTLVVGIAALIITAWKGPGAWSAVSSAVVTLCLLVGTLSILPAKDKKYIEDLEAAVKPADVPAGPSRARLAAKKSP